jgi:hypothetical protein
MTQPAVPTALDQILLKLIAINGTPVPNEPYLNLTGAVSTDNPTFVVDGQVVGATNVAVLGPAAVTGTGVWTSTAGAINAAASLGTADQLLGTNHTAAAPTWITVTPDATLSNGTWTNVGLQGHALPSLTTGYLNWNGTAWVFTSGTAIFTPGGDLGGTDTTQEVIGILSKALPSLAAGTLQYTGSAWQFGTTYPLAASGSCPISFTTSLPSTLNPSISPLATIDWWLPSDATANSYRGNNVINHWKISGGRLIGNAFDFIAGPANNISTSYGDGQITISTNATDDGYSTNMSSVVVGGTGPKDTTNAALGWGYVFRVPCDTYGRTLTVYGGQYSCDVTLTCTASDGSFSVTNLQTVAANAGQGNAWTIGPYNSARDGQYMLVSVLVTANHAGTPNVGFTAALLS